MTHCYICFAVLNPFHYIIKKIISLSLSIVISMGPGREEENGRIAPMPNINVGDVIIAKNPWGIGPKDEETPDGRKLSFMRAQDIAAVLEGKLIDDA